MHPSTFTLEELTDFIEAMQHRYGFVSHVTAAKHFGVSRQAIQKRIRSAYERGALSERLKQRLSPPASTKLVRRELRISPENDEFIQSLAKTHQVTITAVVDAAVSCYRAALTSLEE